MEGNASYTAEPAAMERIIDELRAFLHKLKAKDSSERQFMPKVCSGMEDFIKNATDDMNKVELN